MKLKKLGFMSVLLVAVGSTIGAGIFLKNGAVFSNAHSNIGIVITSWIVATIGIIAIGLCLIEVAKGSENSESGVLAWTNSFTGKWFHKMSRGFMLWAYVPLNMFALPMYAVMSIQDATGATWVLNWWQISLIGFGFYIWFAVISGVSAKLGSYVQVGLTILKFLPFVVITILGIQSAADGAAVRTADLPSGLTEKAAWLGIFASIPAIYFAFDGFYMAANLTKEMKEPKKLPWILTLSILVITAFYVVVAIVTAYYNLYGSDYGVSVMNKVLNWGIAFAVIGIVNGFAIGSPKMYQEAIDANEFLGAKTIKKLFAKNKKYMGFIISVVITIITFIVFAAIGGLWFVDPKALYDGYYGNTSAHNLYGLCDMLTNWTSLLIFIIICGAIVGATYKWIKSGSIKQKKWYYLPSAIIAILITAAGAIYDIVDIFYQMSINETGALSYFIVLMVLVLIGFAVELPVKSKNKSEAVVVDTAGTEQIK